MFTSKLKFLLYIFLRNDYSWSILSKEEKKLIINENNKYNTLRDDYFDIKKFGISRQKEGERWDTHNLEVLLKNKVKGGDAKYLASELNKYIPADVLEIGCGPGLFSKMLFDFKSVRSLTVNDINPQFLEFVETCAEMEESKDKKFDSILGDIKKSSIESRFDMIVIISSLHHIPDRLALFQKMESMLKEGGIIVICEPSYHLLRFYHLLKKFRMFIKNEYISNISNYSTHHMCTKGEYMKIISRCNNLKIENLDYGQVPLRFKSSTLINLSFFKR